MKKNKIENIRAISAYFKSTENEIAIDVLRYRTLNADPNIYCFMPRPTAWKGKIDNYKFFLPFFAFIWRFCFSYLNILFSYLKTLRKSIFKKNGKDLINDVSSIAIAFAPRSISVIDNTLGGISNHKWLVAPWIDNAQVEDQNRIIDFYSLVNFRDLNRIFFLTIVCQWKYKKRIPTSWFLQLYTSFNWFLIYIVLSKFETNFITAEHYDRFAILVDSVMQSRKIKRDLTLVQHGIIRDPVNETVHQANFTVPTKLQCVTGLYVYDKQSEDFFLEKIVAKSNTKVDVKYFSPKLKLSLTGFSSEILILFVGNAISVDLHLFILDKLKARYNFKAYYKPHPTEKIGKRITQQDWIVINDIQFFPRVNFLITYPSTLIREYESLGIHSMVHAIDLSPVDSSDYLKSIECEFDLIKSGKRQIQDTNIYIND